MAQEIQFCKTSDGVRIAYATNGVGSPIVKAANWMNHLEADWDSPVWRHLLDELSARNQFIRYDERGTGLSDRNITDLSLDAFVNDLSAVVEASKVDRFALLGISQGGPVAIKFAKEFPEKVTSLILFGSFATGWKRAGLSTEMLEQRNAQVTLIRQGWHSRNPAIRQLWTTLCIPGGDKHECESFNKLQLASVSPEMAANIFEALGELDVDEILETLDLPVIIFHSRGDAMVPFEEGRKMAARIPNARFVPLESNNHLLLRNEPAWQVFVDNIREFLGHPAESLNDESNTMHLKRCSACGRVYSDPSLRFCFDDGLPLS